MTLRMTLRMTRGPTRTGGASRVSVGVPVRQAGGGLSGAPLGDDGVAVDETGGVTVVEGVVVVVEAVDAADGSVVLIGELDVPEPESDPLTFDVAAVAAPVTLSLMTGAASLAC